MARLRGSDRHMANRLGPVWLNRVQQLAGPIVGGIAIHNRCIAELETGEGKTLVATMPATLNALAGKGVHVVTVNDYLARRDAEWMGPVYQILGLTVGCIQTGQSDSDR